MKKLLSYAKRYAPFACACTLAFFVALTAFWVREAYAKKKMAYVPAPGNTEAISPVQAPEYALPAKGNVIFAYTDTQPAWNNTLRVYETHEGTDYFCPDGNVYAVWNGRVEDVFTDGRYGLTVKIVHENGDVSLYSSLGEAMVKNGQKVKTGDTIARAGTSAWVEAALGEHVHFVYLKYE